MYDTTDGKIGMIMSEILKHLQRRRQDTSHLSLLNAYSLDAGRTVERGTLSSSDRCLLNADGAASPLQVAHRFTHFQLVGYI